MALRLTSATTDGISRVLTRTGGILFVFLLASHLLLLTSINTVGASAAPSTAADALGLTLPVSGTVAGILLTGTLLFDIAYMVVLTRAFTRPHSELDAFPAELYTRRMGRATLWMLIGGVVVFFAVIFGFTFFFLPGLFLATCFIFLIFTIGVEDRGVISGLRRSWALSRGNRIRLGVLVIAIGLTGAITSIVPALFEAAGEPVLSDLASGIVNSVLYIFLYGIVAAAYLQVRTD